MTERHVNYAVKLSKQKIIEKDLEPRVLRQNQQNRPDLNITRTVTLMNKRPPACPVSKHTSVHQNKIQLH